MVFNLSRITTTLYLFVFVLTTLVAQSNEATLSGRVIDAKSKSALPGVLVYFPDLKIGTVSDENGNYRIAHLPINRHLVQVSFVGYRTMVQQIETKGDKVLDFSLESTAAELTEVVVTGLSKAAEMRRTPSPITVVSKHTLQQRTSSNIIDALAMEPGVSQVTTGVGISKPVIRGLGYNRVVVVNDGIRQEGQQWGDEHGIEADEYDVDRVEILKGPASLMYGSDAMAGVVNLLTAPTSAQGKMNGEALANYQTNNGLIGYSLHLGSNKKGLFWDARYSNKMAHAYSNKYDGYVFNSGFKENALKGVIGVNKDWGYSRLTISGYQIKPGMVEGERDGVTGEFLKPIMLPDGSVGETLATHNDFKSYSLKIPFQIVNHYKIVSESSIHVGEGNISSILGYQQNERNEHGDVTVPDEAQLAFKLQTLNYNLHYNFAERNGFNLAMGTSGMIQRSSNRGIEYLVPAYNLFDFGAFVIAKKNIERIDISGGLRYDLRKINGEDLYLDANGDRVGANQPNAEHLFESFHPIFTGFSGSLGATWQISRSIFTKINLSSGFRAPNISELGSNGVHEGTLRYESGNHNLKPERSIQFDYTLGVNTEHVSAELNLFTNRINNYIYLHKLNGATGNDSIQDGNSVFQYVSGDAQLYGGEFRFDIHPHPMDWLHIENRFAFVRAIQLNSADSLRNLPFIPAPNWKIELRGELDRCGRYLKNGFASILFDHYFAQDKIFSAYGTESTTPSYSLVNATLGFDVARRTKSIFSVVVGLNNLFDVAYQNHLSRLKYAAENSVTGRSGVFNMGRNVSIKVIVPLNF